MRTLGQRARERREELGLTQEKVGKYCGVSQEAIRQMESDELQRPPRYIDELINVLQTTKEWLKNGIPPKENIYYPQDRPSVPGGLAEGSRRGKRAKLAEFLAIWDTATDEEREQFLAIALMEHKKEPPSPDDK